MEAIGLDNINLMWILLPFFIGGVFYVRVVKNKTGNALRDGVKTLQTMLIMIGVILAVIFLTLPTTASLSTFGYPDTVTDIDSQEKVLKLLQEYNHAIVRTTDALRWMVFIFIFWGIMTVYQLLKVYRGILDERIIAKKNEINN
ncbi:hypothetical protein GN157_10100 [Flavobacterium rakeshii]|uniref:Uncharacterized protein n=1 Tax=Flavobacterium rakeshii TaxID=1038845 RepID=A0A6N8HC82_9FLAO|nr:hypothetical protein [Flavobacterium rakeshii]MEE1898931.1 hypothetical protein [Flavobacterium rakeshii]MUV04061.1 hypothetical protein [Flavobacterium rakeshii]